MQLGNCCSEVAVSAALKKHFPILHMKFNKEHTAQNDLQLDLLSVFQNFPGQNIDYFNLTDGSACEALLKTLDSKKIYCVRTGQNNGSGHFSFMHFERDKWILSTGPEQHETLANSEGDNLRIDIGVFNKIFRVNDPQSCGSGSHQYSLRINELTLTRTIAAMNYIAMFRAIPEDMTLNEGERRQLTEIAVIEKFQSLVDTDADGLFLKLTPEAATYWGQNNHEVAIITDEPTQALQRRAVYQHLLCVQDNPEYLDRLLHLGFPINQPIDQTGHTLLHLAVQTKSLQAVRALLSKGADNTVKNNEGKTASDLLQQMAQHETRSEILHMQNCFSNIEIDAAIESKKPPEQFTALLENACHWNNYLGVEKLLAHGADVFAHSEKGDIPIEILIKMADENHMGWTSIEDALYSLLDKMMETDKTRGEECLRQLLLRRLPTSAPFLDIDRKTTKGTLRTLAIKHGCKTSGHVPAKSERLAIKNQAPTHSESKTNQSQKDRIILRINTPPTIQITAENTRLFVDRAVNHYIAPEYSKHYTINLTTEQTSQEPIVELVHISPEALHPPQVLLTAKPNKVSVHRAFIRDKHIQGDAKVMMILQALGIPPTYPTKLYISHEQSHLGQAIIKAYSEMKAVHDQSYTQNDDPSSPSYKQ